ncbi:MAG TPA: 1,4-alpha-glucan branching protein domain-containing protein [Thermoguttaceae bacterium]|nr:1,4-alpha-glucan branching protein domain-containing protein [Thermoguttaceae bacterium]
MPKGYLLLILHAHLPYVRHPEYDRFLEERWFFEAVTETYIPLVKFFDKLQEEGVPLKLTVSISPTLANMMNDPLLCERCARHLEMMIRLAEQECERTRDWPDVNSLSWMYKRLFEEARETFVERYDMRLLTAFRRYAESGGLELITCAGTHGFLPLLSSEPHTVRAQVFAAVREHERLFGSKPKGLWLPECAYYPGLDDVLAEAGVRYFVVDSHGIENADPRPLFGVNAPVYCPSGVAAFGRHPTTSKLVWSSNVGYPADYNYREYYRDIGYDLDDHYLEPFRYAEGIRSPTGIKYHRITGTASDKHLYNPDWAAATAYRHAQDFAHRCRDQASRCRSHMPFPPVIVSPYDAELFGHWWFEGPQWLYQLMKELAGGGDLEPSTPGEYLATYPIQQRATPSPNSWGQKGYHAHWVNAKTDWIWRPLHEAAVRMRQTVERNRAWPPRSLEARVLRQAGRELMLAQSSDWPFMITKGHADQYARRRISDHLNRFHHLLGELDSQQIDPQRLEAFEHMDAIFPELDHHLFAPSAV